ncbi:MAG: mechanosensitive ion channel domain-containing protein [Methanospirillum sp.]
MLFVPLSPTGDLIAGLVLAIGLVLAGVAAGVAVFAGITRIEERFEGSKQRGLRVVANTLIAVKWPLPIGIVAASIFVALRFALGLDLVYPQLGDPRYPVAVAILLVAWGAANLFSRLARAYGQQVIPTSEGDGDTRMADLVGASVRYLIWFIAILYLLSYLNISITPLLAGAGIAGIAIALAAQDLLSNLFGGVIILLDKPLGVGDKVRIDPYVGTVTRIGLRSTRIRTLDGLVATVPNSRITTNIVVNYTAGTARAFVQVPVTVDYATPVAESRRVLEEIARTAPTAAPPEMELGEGTVQIGELGRFGPVFILTFSARDDTDPLAIKDVVYALAAEAVRSGRLSIAFGRQREVQEPDMVVVPEGDGDRRG